MPKKTKKLCKLRQLKQSKVLLKTQLRPKLFSMFSLKHQPRRLYKLRKPSKLSKQMMKINCPHMNRVSLTMKHNNKSLMTLLKMYQMYQPRRKKNLSKNQLLKFRISRFIITQSL